MSDARVLIAHRSLGLRQSVRFELERLGFTCDEADIGYAALPMIERGSYEVAMIGSRFIGMSGWSVLEQAREIRPDLSVVVFGGPPIRLDDRRILLVDGSHTWWDAVNAVLELFQRRALRRAA